MAPPSIRIIYDITCTLTYCIIIQRYCIQFLRTGCRFMQMANTILQPKNSNRINRDLIPHIFYAFLSMSLRA